MKTLYVLVASILSLHFWIDGEGIPKNAEKYIADNYPEAKGKEWEMVDYDNYSCHFEYLNKELTISFNHVGELVINYSLISEQDIEEDIIENIYDNYPEYYIDELRQVELPNSKKVKYEVIIMSDDDARIIQLSDKGFILNDNYIN